MAKKRGRKDKIVALANRPLFKIAGIRQPLLRGGQRPAADARGELDGTEGGRDPVEATTRVRISPSAFDFPFLGLKELSFEKRADFRVLISDSKMPA